MTTPTPTAVRPCRVCGTADAARMVRQAAHPTGLANLCRSDNAATTARYRRENPERQRESDARYSSANRARWTAPGADPYADPREKRCSSCREEQPRARFSTDPTTRDGLQARCRPCAAQYERDRCRSRAVPSWLALGIDPDVCLYCRAPAEEVEHVLPRVLGGTDARTNLAPSCIPCNRGADGKGATPVVWWIVRRFGDEAADVLARLFASGLDVESPASTFTA